MPPNRRLSDRHDQYRARGHRERHRRGGTRHDCCRLGWMDEKAITMIITPPVKLDSSIFDTSTSETKLLCPKCGGEYLHQSNVTVYQRQYEDGPVAEILIEETTVHFRQSTVPSPRHPSRRRQGLAISFSCEDCDFKGDLTIAQHKGNTLVGWRPPINATIDFIKHLNRNFKAQIKEEETIK